MPRQITREQEPLSPSSPRAVQREAAHGGTARPPVGRLVWAIAAAALLVLLGGAGLLRWRAAHTASRVTAPAAGEDRTEWRLRGAVEARPNDPAAHLQFGQYYEGQGRTFEAMWEYAEARSPASGSPAPADPELPLRLAAVLRAGGAMDLAMDQLSQALRARPEDLAVRRELADLSLAAAEPRRACSVLEERRAAVWRDVDAVVTLGRARQAAGDDAGAAAAFQRACSLDGKNAEALYRSGRLYLRQGQSERARDSFFHAMFYDQRRPEYPFYAGMAYLQAPGPTSLNHALRFFRDTLALDSHYAAAHDQSGRILERMGQRSTALTQYSLATVDDPSDADPLPALSRGLAAVGRTPDAHHFMGRYYDLKDRPADAIREYQRMQAAAPDDAEPALLMGQVYLRMKQPDKAAAVTAAALKRHPHDPELLERLAVLEINRGDWSSARRLLQQWLSQDPKASRACWLLGRCELGALNYAEAVRWLEKADGIEPHNPHFLGFLGAALLKQGTPDSRRRAAEVLAQSVDRAPDEAEYRDLYGQALQALGRYEAARRQFLRALDADPMRIAAYLAASQLAWRLKQPGPAALFPTVVRSVQWRTGQESLLWLYVWRHPTDTTGRLKLARFFCRTGRLTQARDELEQVLAQQPVSPEARQLLQTVQRALEVQ